MGSYCSYLLPKQDDGGQREVFTDEMCHFVLLLNSDIDFGDSLDVGLVEGGEDGVDGHGCGGEVEVIEEDGQVVVQAPRRAEPDVEGPARHALDRTDSMIHNQLQASN